MAFRFLALLAFATSMVALPAIANDLDDCDQNPRDMSVPQEADIADEVEALAPSDVVVPCAMVESGVLGPACQDAAFYVVNQHGTLLCRVELAVFTQAGSLPIVEQAPAAPAAQQGSSVVVAVVPLLPPSLPAASVIELERQKPPALLQAADAHVSDRLRPS
jgi:hypothetical protein